MFYFYFSKCLYQTVLCVMWNVCFCFLFNIVLHCCILFVKSWVYNGMGRQEGRVMLSAATSFLASFNLSLWVSVRATFMGVLCETVFVIYVHRQSVCCRNSSRWNYVLYDAKCWSWRPIIRQAIPPVGPWLKNVFFQIFWIPSSTHRIMKQWPPPLPLAILLQQAPRSPAPYPSTSSFVLFQNLRF